MNFAPFDRMASRVRCAEDNGDVELFSELMYQGEFLVKMIVAGMLASVGDDPDAQRYRVAHRLVRANGIGEWAHVLDEIVTGPPAQFIVPDGREVQRALTQKNAKGSWEHEAVTKLRSATSEITDEVQTLGSKVQLKSWLQMFALLRNKSPRGHGAPRAGQLSRAIPGLAASLQLVQENVPLFSKSWAHIRKNMSGKYRVSYLNHSSEVFDKLKRDKSGALQDGVYVDMGKPRLVELLVSDDELTDFLFPNGGFNSKTYELLSYITGQTARADAAPYMRPATPLPPAATEGVGRLDARGQCFTNLPHGTPSYVSRPQLENKITDCLLDTERYRIVTLLGPGGIGKTSTTLRVLEEVTKSGRFEVVIWFSARDIELLEEGPKPVRPHVLNADQIANEYVRLLEPGEAHKEKFDAKQYMSAELTKASMGPTLFVFDNFETVTAPADLFNWLDACIRHPNKALITTRFRDFKGDYPVEVEGMEEAESMTLIGSTCIELRITEQLLARKDRQALHLQCDGHPYVMKVLLGEIAKTGRVVRLPEATHRDEMLTALFERSYSQLSLPAQRVFLTLCNWRSLVPAMALKAVLLARSREIDVDAAIDELEASALVEVGRSADGHTFVNVLATAALFGKRKSKTSPLSPLVEEDLELLQLFGPSKESDLKQGVEPRMRRLFSTVKQRGKKDPSELNRYLPVLQFVAKDYPQAWLQIADLFTDSRTDDGTQTARDALERFLETVDGEERADAWRRMAQLSARAGDVSYQLHAWCEFAREAGSVESVSEAANEVNRVLADYTTHVDQDERKSVVRRLIDLFELHVDTATGTELSRLAWLHLNAGDDAQARRCTKLGFEKDPHNKYLQGLARKLGIEG